jgi:hypothetical protein
VSGPRVGGRGGDMSRCAEGAFRIKLKVAMQVPLLKCKSETLITEKFRVKLVLIGCWDEDKLIVVDSRGEQIRFVSSRGVSEGDRTNSEEEEVVREVCLVVGKGRCGEERTSKFEDKLQNDAKHSLANFKLLAEDETTRNTFLFDGKNYQDSDKNVGSFINLPQRQRKGNYDVN